MRRRFLEIPPCRSFAREVSGSGLYLAEQLHALDLVVHDLVELDPLHLAAGTVGHPGALVHQDHKKLGRIPDGGGHRALGRAAAPSRHRSGLGYDHFEVIVDDRSRRSVVVHVPDETAANAAIALETNAYRAALGERRHSRTRPYRPQTNGKAERFIGTLVREWAYARPYRSNSERLAALPAFVDFYNQRRPHLALGGLSPAAVVNNVRGDHI